MRAQHVAWACALALPALAHGDPPSESDGSSRVHDEPAIDQAHLAATALVTSAIATAAVGVSGVRLTAAYDERVELSAGVSAVQLALARAKAEVLQLGRLHVAVTLDGFYAREGFFGGGGLVASACLARCRTVFSVSSGVVVGAYPTWIGSASAIVRVTDNVKLVGELDVFSKPIDEVLGQSFGWYGIRVHRRRIAFELGFDVGTRGVMFNLPLFNLVVST